MRKNYSYAIIIVEGESLLRLKSGVHIHSIYGALLSLNLNCGCAVIFSKDKIDTAFILSVISTQILLIKRSFPSRIKRFKIKQKIKQQLYVLEGLPNVGVVLAKRLLGKFRTVENVMTATEEELMAVPGVGRIKAKIIRSVLT